MEELKRKKKEPVISVEELLQKMGETIWTEDCLTDDNTYLFRECFNIQQADLFFHFPAVKSPGQSQNLCS